MKKAQLASGAKPDRIEEITDFLFAGGTVADLYRIEARQLEAVYAHAFNLYGQARWNEALRIFSFLALQNHLERRFHIGKAACLQMLKRYEDALRAYGLAHVLDVSEPTVALHIAECCIALRRKEDARTALETVMVLADESPAFAPIRARAKALAALLAA